MVWAALNQQHYQAIAEIAKTKSDRIIAVVGGAIIDDSLRRHLELRLRPLHKNHTDMNEKLFKPTGALGNLVPKIDLAYQLYMFEKPVRNALWGIAEIRNMFAHHLIMSFKDKSKDMETSINKLTLHIGRTHYPEAFFGSGDSKYELHVEKGRRGHFIVNLQLCLLYLMRDGTSHEPWSNVPRNQKVIVETLPA
jgi:hypothetical protein